MNSVRRSIFWSFVQRYLGLVISFLTILILSRLLTPEEIGIYSVGLAFVALAHVLRDFGVGDYIVQEKELTEARMKTAFGVSLVIGWTIGLLVILFSEPISWLYGEPGLRRVLQVLGLSFFVIPFSLPVLALLRRQMAFHIRARITVTAAVVHAVFAVTLAATGFSYMSLAWASLAGVITTALLASRHRPAGLGFWPSLAEWKHVSSFGGMATGTMLLTVLGERAPDFVLGRVLGFGAVGMYSRGESIVNLFREGALSAIGPVVMPAFSSRHRAGADIKPDYLKGIAYLTGIAWPFFGFVSLMAYPVIRILFGPQWDAAVPVAQILCLGAALAVPWEFGNHALMAVGQVRKEMNVQIITVPGQIAVLIILASHGIEMAALAAVFRYAMLSAVRTHYLKQQFNIGFFDIVRSTSKSLVLALGTCVAPAAVAMTQEIGPGNLWLPLLSALGGAGVLWLLAIFVLDHPLKDEVLMYANNARRFLARGNGQLGEPD